MKTARTMDAKACGQVMTSYATAVAVVGVVVGIVGTWYGQLTGDSADAVSAGSAAFLPSVAVLGPLALWAASRVLGRGQVQARCYRTLRDAVLLFTMAGGLGSIGAVVAYIVVAVQLPSAFGDYEQEAILAAVRSHLLWTPVLGTLVASVVGTAVVGAVVHCTRSK